MYVYLFAGIYENMFKQPIKSIYHYSYVHVSLGDHLELEKSGRTLSM